MEGKTDIDLKDVVEYINFNLRNKSVTKESPIMDIFFIIKSEMASSHPDLASKDDYSQKTATEKFQKLNDYYQFLSDHIEKLKNSYFPTIQDEEVLHNINTLELISKNDQLSKEVIKLKKVINDQNEDRKKVKAFVDYSNKHKIEKESEKIKKLYSSKPKYTFTGFIAFSLLLLIVKNLATVSSGFSFNIFNSIITTTTIIIAFICCTLYVLRGYFIKSWIEEISAKITSDNLRSKLLTDLLSTNQDRYSTEISTLEIESFIRKYIDEQRNAKKKFVKLYKRVSNPKEEIIISFLKKYLIYYLLSHKLISLGETKDLQQYFTIQISSENRRKRTYPPY